MIKALLALAVIWTLTHSAPEAQASNCALDEYDHNGSLMELQVCDGGGLTISYIRPRSGLRPHGVRDGTLLFDGVEQASGQISGQARLFSGRCGAITYTVSGLKDQSGTIVLRGSAPVRNKNCRVTRYKSDRLVFTLLGAAAPGPQVVTPSCPPGFVLQGANCVRASAVAPTPSCPPGFVFSGGKCVRSGGSASRPAGSGGDWYAIAGSFRKRGEAEARQRALGFGWTVMNTAQCPNFGNGYWIATAGPFSKQKAQAYSGGAGHFGAYVKTCH